MSIMRAFIIYGFHSYINNVNHVPYSVLFNLKEKAFAVTLQTFNARLITQVILPYLIMMRESRA